MINLFFIKKNFSGVKTYEKELLQFLLNKEDVCVHTISIGREFLEYEEIEESPKTTELRIPLLTESDVISKEYAKRIVFLIYKHLQNKENIIFHLNCPNHTHICLEAKKMFPIKVVYTLHFLPSYFYSSHIQGVSPEELIITNKEMDELIVKKADCVICVTNFARLMLNKFYGISLKKTVLIYNGCGIINKESLEVTSTFNKRDLGFQEKDKLLLYVGRISEPKGLFLLIKAFKIIHKKNPHLKLIIVGDGNYERALSLANDTMNGIFFTGKMDKQKLTQLYSIVDLGIIPSLFEQCSYVALEMMQNGIPIISSNSPGLKEIFIDNPFELPLRIKKGGLGLHIHEKDFIQNIEKFLSLTPEDIIQLSKNLKVNWRTNHTADKMSELTIRQYKKLIRKEAKREEN